MPAVRKRAPRATVRAGVVSPISQGVQLLACGADPIWAVWAAWSEAAGVAFAPRPARLPAAGGVLLVSPWEQPGPEALAAARRSARGAAVDIWLVHSEPSPELQAEVLAGGGRGCLPRLPGEEAVRRALQLAAWTFPGGQPGAAEVERRAGQPRAAVAAPPAARVGSGGPPPARLAPPQRRGWERAAPRPSAGQPWWAWPEAAGPEAVLAVVAPWPVPAAWVEEAAGVWEAAAGRPPGTALRLGSLPAPLRGALHPAIGRAAAAQAVAVLTAADWTALDGARRLVDALRACGALRVAVWLAGGAGGVTARQLALALGVPCAAIPVPADAMDGGRPAGGP